MISSRNSTVLLVDDDSQVLEMLEDLFSEEYDTLTASSGKESIEIVRQHGDIAVVVMDIKIPDMDGITSARQIQDIETNVSVIFHTGYPGEYDEDEINETERPFEYIEKGGSVAKLKRAVRNGAEQYRLKKNAGILVAHAEANYDIIGKTPAMQEIYKLIAKFAAADKKVIITGESGTGKELVAKAIHKHSRRRDQRWTVYNCNHRNPDLVESELFGHVKGAFTNAYADRIGFFEYADGGTIFLDEIGDLNYDTQTKLLGVLERGEFSSVGSPEIKNTDVRVLCATNKDLSKMVDTGEFRNDLFFRLEGLEINLPPLRERREDIPLLVEKYKDDYTNDLQLTPKWFEQKAMAILVDYDWPGNIRELINTVESLITLSDSDVIFADEVSKYLKNKNSSLKTGSSGFKIMAEQVKECQTKAITAALAATNYNIAAAARLLGMDRANLRRMMRRLGLDKSQIDSH